MILKGILLKRMILPTGSSDGSKIFSTTVCPTRQTLAAPFTSSLPKEVPDFKGQLRMVRKSGLTPCIVVGQFIEALITWPRLCTAGDTAFIYCASAVSYTHLRAHETPEHLVCR